MREHSVENGANVKYPENGLGAGIFYSGSYKSCVLGSPIEAVSDDEGKRD
jgi:hypothetical protein